MNHERTHIDLFSGIGGFALAAQRNGLRTATFCECEPNCVEFLSRAWPGVPCWPDVRTFDGGAWRGAFLLTAGVPCQPASRAGKQLGKKDDRWLWGEAVRVLGEARPAWALFENPAGIADVGLAGILSDVGACGYEVQVFSIPACAVGAPHGRERYWIVCRGLADADSGRQLRKGGTKAKQNKDRQDWGIHNGSDSETVCGMADASRWENNSGRNGYMAEEEERRRSSNTAVGSSGKSIVADAAVGRLGIDRCASRNAGHADQCCEGGMADLARNGQREQSAPQRPDGERTGQDGQYGIVADAAQSDRAEHGRETLGCGRVPKKCLGHAEENGSRAGLCDCRPGEQRRDVSPDAGIWSRFVWLPCADGKVRRAPDDSFGMAHGLPVELLETLAGKEASREEIEALTPHRSLLAALGNSIVWQVAVEIIRAIVIAEAEMNEKCK